MKKATGVCCVMILLLLATFMNVDGLGPSNKSGRKRYNDGYFEDASSKGITEKREEMRRNIFSHLPVLWTATVNLRINDDLFGTRTDRNRAWLKHPKYFWLINEEV